MSFMRSYRSCAYVVSFLCLMACHSTALFHCGLRPRAKLFPELLPDLVAELIPELISELIPELIPDFALNL